MKLPAELLAEQVVAVIDTREQCPLDLSPLQVRIGTLTTGDYSIVGLEHVVAVERKSLGGLTALPSRCPGWLWSGWAGMEKRKQSS